MSSFGASLNPRAYAKRALGPMTKSQKNEMPKDYTARIELMKSLKRLVELRKATSPNAGVSRNPLDFSVLYTKPCAFCGCDFVYHDVGAERVGAQGGQTYCSDDCRDAGAELTAGARKKTDDSTKARPGGNRRRVQGFKLYARIAKSAKPHTCTRCKQTIKPGEQYANQNGAGHMHMGCYKRLLDQAQSVRSLRNE